MDFAGAAATAPVSWRIVLAHAVEVGGGRWSCSCGAGGESGPGRDLTREAIEHDRRVHFKPPYNQLPEGVLSAREAYTALIRDLRPRVRALGFKGSGPKFTWPSESHVAVVTLSKDPRWCNLGTVYFDLSASVTARDEWLTRQHPNQLNNGAGARWHLTSSQCIPNATGDYWVLRAGEDWGPLTDALIDVIREHFVPELRNRTGA